MSDFYAPSTYLKVFAAGILLASLGIAGYTYLSPSSSASSPHQGEELRVSTDASVMTVYASPTCGCCSKWVDHLKEEGLSAEIVHTSEMGAVKQRLGVPTSLHSCHTGVIGNYVVEGHVPAADVKRLLNEQPSARGLVVPGMPIGSPGMERGSTKEPYDVLAFRTDGTAGVFASYR